MIFSRTVTVPDTNSVVSLTCSYVRSSNLIKFGDDTSFSTFNSSRWYPRHATNTVAINATVAIDLSPVIVTVVMCNIVRQMKFQQHVDANVASLSTSNGLFRDFCLTQTFYTYIDSIYFCFVFFSPTAAKQKLFTQKKNCYNFRIYSMCSMIDIFREMEFKTICIFDFNDFKKKSN